MAQSPGTYTTVMLLSIRTPRSRTHSTGRTSAPHIVMPSPSQCSSRRLVPSQINSVLDGMSLSQFDLIRRVTCTAASIPPLTPTQSCLGSSPHETFSKTEWFSALCHDASLYISHCDGPDFTLFFTQCYESSAKKDCRYVGRKPTLEHNIN